MHASSAERFAFGESTPDLTATDVPYGFDDDMWSLERTNDYANPVAASKLPFQKPMNGNSGSAFCYAI